MASPFTTTMIVLGLLGVLDAGYISYSHRKKQPLVCPLDHDCSIVTESKWSRFLGIRNETLGLLFYISVILGTFLELHRLVMISAAIGVLVSIMLIYLQAKVIKDYCFYCIISAILNALIFMNALALVQ